MLLRTLAAFAFPLAVPSTVLALQVSPPETEVQVMCVEGQEPVVLCYRQWASCVIDTNVDTDAFRFWGQAGDAVRLTLNSPTGLDPSVRLLDPSGTEIDSAFCANNCSIDKDFVLLPQRGAYTLLVKDNNQDEGGAYTLSLERILPDVPVPAIDYGVTATIPLGFNVDRDFVSFQGEAGTLIEIGFNSPTGLDPFMTVYNPDGTVFVTASCANNCSVFLDSGTLGPLPQTGTYMMEFSDIGHDEGGTMTVNITCPLFNCPAPRIDVPLGSSYCSSNPNSTGAAALITASGSPIVADNYVNLLVESAPAGQIGIFFAGPNQAFVPNFGTSLGILCVGNPQTRLNLTMTCANGTARFSPNMESLPPGQMVQPGSTWNFQFWHRDVNPAPPSNTTDGVAITF